MTSCQPNLNHVVIIANLVAKYIMDKEGAYHNPKRKGGIHQILLDTKENV